MGLRGEKIMERVQRADGNLPRNVFLHPFKGSSALLVTGLFLSTIFFTGCGLQRNSPAGKGQPVFPSTAAMVVASPLMKTPENSSAATVWWKQSSADSGWGSIQRGLERRKIILQDAALNPLEELLILRIDPDLFSMDVGYDTRGKTLDSWQLDTGAAAVVNGGYFQKEDDVYLPAGLIVVGGKAIGNSYGSFAGMLAVGKTVTELRWLAVQPYDPREPLLAAIQSFPVLIKPDGQIGFSLANEDYLQARRTVVGQDRGGRIVFLVASVGAFTLHQLSVYLHDSDLDLKIAMNLDGGPSSGMLIANPREIIPARYPLPVVVMINPR
jgi:hypothetical protein